MGNQLLYHPPLALDLFPQDSDLPLSDLKRTFRLFALLRVVIDMAIQSLQILIDMFKGSFAPMIDRLDLKLKINELTFLLGNGVGLHIDYPILVQPPVLQSLNLGCYTYHPSVKREVSRMMNLSLCLVCLHKNTSDGGRSPLQDVLEWP